MKFATAFTALLPALTSALAVPITATTAMTAADVPATPSTIADAMRIAERDSLWPWERPPHIIGEYPDGRKKCRIMSMTAGHTEGPCPPRLPDAEIPRILRQEWCSNNCCDEDNEPCKRRYHGWAVEK